MDWRGKFLSRFLKLHNNQRLRKQLKIGALTSVYKKEVQDHHVAETSNKTEEYSRKVFPWVLNIKPARVAIKHFMHFLRTLMQHCADTNNRD